MKYSDYFMGTLKKEGFTHCFYVAGGNSMHLLESASRYFTCVPVVHEVTAAIAAEYFTESGTEKAFALATAGPGLTNMTTGIAGAWLESHELLVVGGQVKSENLKQGGIRQGGIQEIDGVALTKSITKRSVRIETPVSEKVIHELVTEGRSGRKGPVFIEVCLDASAAICDFVDGDAPTPLENSNQYKITDELGNDFDQLIKLIESSSRPLVLLGNGISRKDSQLLVEELVKFKVPIATTWSGADRCSFDYPYYAGRPNTFGMRWANIFQQQADLLVVIGSSLGLQQTGFNISAYLPVGNIVHVDIDETELAKSSPKQRLTINMNSKDFSLILPKLFGESLRDVSEWTTFLDFLRRTVPNLEESQISKNPYISPHQVIQSISNMALGENPVVICSSGGTFTAGMQCFENKNGQILLANKGLASMGYGLAGAIGVAFQNLDVNTLLFEGDGGFAQNLQDLGTVASNKLRIKMFITNNQGYASIRTSQKNYFNGNYLGCDIQTGLGFPNWKRIVESYGIKYFELTSETIKSKELISLVDSPEAVFFEVISDPEQMYLPKVSSAINPDGSMSSTPIHDMLPKLPSDVAGAVFKFIPIPQ
jgi:acetolactate synthase-1/2/3 large subunit